MVTFGYLLLSIRTTLHREMVCRVFKNNLRRLLRNKMKEMNKLLEEPYRRIILAQLNIFIETSKDSKVRG